MTKKEKVINGLEHCCLDDEGYPSCKGCPYGPCNVRCGGDLHADALALLKAQATIEPKRIELTDETKAWLDKMDAVDALGNIADICMDWDGYRTANGLGGLVNEVWAYARYCADRLHKAREPRVMTISRVLNLKESTPVWLEDVDKKDIMGALFMRNYTGTKCVDFAIVRDWEFERVVADYMDYGVRWRCWTSRPTDAQREATPWN